MWFESTMWIIVAEYRHYFCDTLFLSDKEQICEDVLSNITEGVCRPLRNRVEQILLSEHGAVILYRLTNLIRFYGNTIKQVISSNKSTLIETLDDLDQLAYNQFMSVLQATVQQQTSG